MSRSPARRGRPAVWWASAVVAGVVAAALVRLPRVVVDGVSMIPVLGPGERLLVLPLRARPGRLVVVRDPRLPGRLLVKRVAAVLTDGSIDVRGDNAGASTDSRDFGPVEASAVGGRPVFRYHPPDQAGWIWNA